MQMSSPPTNALPASQTSDKSCANAQLCLLGFDARDRCDARDHFKVYEASQGCNNFVLLSWQGDMQSGGAVSVIPSSVPSEPASG